MNLSKKKTFYAFSRYTDKTDGSVKVGYLPRDGFNVPNDCLLDLAVYKATDSSAATNWKEATTWFVVDCRCGLSVASGSTKKEAVENALDKLSKVDMEMYDKKVYKHVTTYGYPPGHGVSYL